MFNKLNLQLTQKFKLQILLAIYIAAILVTNFLGSKIWEIQYPDFISSLLSFLDVFKFQFGNQEIVPFSSQSLSFSVGLFAFPFAFLVTDIITEVKGKEEANDFFKVGLLILGIVLLYTSLAVNLPPAVRWDRAAFPGASFTQPEAYNFVFGSSIRFMIASFTAFGISQFLDILIFNRLKKKAGDKKLWLRNNLSTICSQFIDTAIFYLVALTKLPFAIPFLGIQAGSGLDFDFILRIFIPYFIFKVLFALFDTPLVYLGVWWLKKGDKEDVKLAKKA
jgi:uncharacterized integral membrane protein (TIGR00697 family)